MDNNHNNHYSVESSPTLLTLAPRYRAKPDVNMEKTNNMVKTNVNMEKTNHFNIIKTMIDAKLSLNILFP